MSFVDINQRIQKSFNLDDILSEWDRYVNLFKGSNALDDIRKEAKNAGTEVTYRALLLYESGKHDDISAVQKMFIKGALGYFQNPYDLIRDSIKQIGYYDDLIVLTLSCNRIADIISNEIKKKSITELKVILPKYDNAIVEKVNVSIDNAAKSINNIKEKAENIKEITTQTAQNISTSVVCASHAIGESLDEIKQTEEYQKIVVTGEKIGEQTIAGAKYVTGVQAYRDRQEVQDLNKKAEEIKAAVESRTEELRVALNEGLDDLGKIRLEALHNTVGRFIKCIKLIGQGAKAKEYQFLKDVSIDPGHIREMEILDMKASDALKVLTVGGGFAAVGIAATPAIVTSTITAWCAASTGTAISTLSGAAAKSAVLAWLGGGSIAAGGGGMAAGTIVLGAITGGVAVGAAVISIGSLCSAFYSRKLTEATKYLAAVQEWEVKIKQSWVALEAMQKRIAEIKAITIELEKRTSEQLEKLESIINYFNYDNMTHVETFQRSAVLVKSMSELAQVSLLDEDGNLTEESNIVAVNTQKLLNTEL